MTAVAYVHPYRSGAATVAAPDAASPVRPVRLVVVGTGVTGQGRAAPKVPPAVFRRRRAVAVLVLVTVVVAAWLGLRALWAGPLPGPERSGAAGRIVYVVQPGDTLW
ncbi:MAG: hypothetical protein M3179_05940, partial [Actinomycetota bacterium]|nr:hypothetical protein [Actinomycetota bacterium]